MKRRIIVGLILGVLFLVSVFLMSIFYVADPGGPVDSLAVAGGVVYVGSGDYLVYAFGPSPSEQTYSVTFTESGLPSGTSWTVILNSVYLSSYSNSITFSVPNGVYAFNITEVGGWPTVYTASPSSGSVTVKGENINVQIIFTLTTPKYPSLILPSLFIIITILAAAILAVVLYRRRTAVVLYRRKIAVVIHRRRKILRYLRWASKAAFLLFFIVPVVYLVGAIERPVYSLLFEVWVGKPWLKVPITQSVCIVWTSPYMTKINPGTWVMCPLGACSTLLTGMVDNFRVIPTIIAMLIFIIPIVLLGNVFCSWVCPVGTIIDSFDKGIEKFFPKFEAKRSKRSIQSRQSKNNRLGSHLLCPVCPVIKVISVSKVISNRIGVLAYGILGSVLVGSAVFNFPVFCCVCPMGIISRGMVHLKALSMRLPTARVTGQYIAIVPELLVIPVAAVLVSLREKRFWCRKLCPLGALLSAVGTLNPFIKPKVKQHKCIMKGCPEDCEDYHIDYCGWCHYFDDRKCEKVCPVGINLVDPGSLHKCTKCMECYIVCDWNAVKVDLVGKPDVSRIGGFFKHLSAQFRKKGI
jgi:ferredoxin-type protein NapH